MIIMIKPFLNSKLDLIWPAKFVKQLFRIQIQKCVKVLLWNQVKSKMEAWYSELILMLCMYVLSRNFVYTTRLNTRGYNWIQIVDSNLFLAFSRILFWIIILSFFVVFCLLSPTFPIFLKCYLSHCWTHTQHCMEKLVCSP